MLRGVLYKPAGEDPFPAVLYNHDTPWITARRAARSGRCLRIADGSFYAIPAGQGLSASAGPYIRDEIAAAYKTGGIAEAAAPMVRLLETDHLNDQMAALAWLRKREYVRADRIAVAGNSFGGIETVLGAGRGSYCAAIDLSGGAESWRKRRRSEP